MSAKVTCRGADITEHVAAMFDALVCSLDWGSGFLDAETIESVLIVAELAGFDVGASRVDTEVPGFPTYQTVRAADPKATREQEHTQHRQWLQDRAKAIESWRAQVQAKARAMATEES